jgi:hypothetical protein
VEGRKKKNKGRERGKKNKERERGKAGKGTKERT